MNKQVQKAFNTPEGKIVDTVFQTSDDRTFFVKEQAHEHAGTLADMAVTEYHKDELLRRYAANKKLNQLIILVDWLKQHILGKLEKPSYNKYLAACMKANLKAVDEKAYGFCLHSVYVNRQYEAMGMTQDIYCLDGNVTSGRLIKKYDNTKLFISGNQLVMTCPSNIEFMTASVYDVFNDIMGDEPHAVGMKEIQEELVSASQE